MAIDVVKSTNWHSITNILFFCSDGKIVDLHFKSAVEGVIIKWATQITEVLGADSVTAFKCNQHLTPWAGNLNL